jgi:hypothetical protein
MDSLIIQSMYVLDAEDRSVLELNAVAQVDAVFGHG